MRGNSKVISSAGRAIVTLALAFLAGNSNAGTTVFSYTNTQPDTLGNWAQTFQFPQFNPSLGLLESVQVQVAYDVTVDGSVYNPGNNTVDCWFSAESLLRVGLPNDLGSLAAIAEAGPIHLTLEGYANADFGTYTFTELASLTLEGANALSAFAGTGTITLSAQSLSWPIVVGGNGNVDTSLTAQSAAVLTIEYIDSVVVPEPASSLLLISGLALLGLSRRKGV